jgi:hypothetical protein
MGNVICQICNTKVWARYKKTHAEKHKQEHKENIK